MVLCLLVGSALPILYTTRAARTAPLSAEQRTKESQPAGVSCLGRIEPEDGVVHVAAPYLFGRPGLVKLLHAREGDRVRQGQLLAVLEGRDQLQASLEQAQARIAVVRRRLELVKAGPKSGDVSAQRAEIARLEANLQNAQGEFNRYETLRRTDDVTVSEVEAKRTAMLTAQRSVETAQNRLQSLLEIRQADIDLAEAELQSAIADEQRARRDFEMSVVHAPMAGQVLKIHARAGEEVGPKGLLELGRTDRMYAVAEVY